MPFAGPRCPRTASATRTSGFNWVNRTISTPTKIVELIAGGMAPRRNSRGRRTIRPNPRTSNPAPVTSSATAFATVATIAAPGHGPDQNRWSAGGVSAGSDRSEVQCVVWRCGDPPQKRSCRVDRPASCGQLVRRRPVRFGRRTDQRLAGEPADRPGRGALPHGCGLRPTGRAPSAPSCRRPGPRIIPGR